MSGAAPKLLAEDYYSSQFFIKRFSLINQITYAFIIIKKCQQSINYPHK